MKGPTAVPPSGTETTPTPQRKPLPAPMIPAALAGLLSGAAGLSTAHLIAEIVNQNASPILAVGGLAIDSAPRQAKEFAINNFGTNDKFVLVTGIVLTVGLLTMLTGIIAGHRFRHGIIAVACLGAIAIAAVLQRPSTGPLDALPTVLGLSLAVVALKFMLKPLRIQPGDPAQMASQLVRGSRREFLITGTGTAVVTAAALGTGQQVNRRKSVAKLRSAVQLPAPASRAAALPDGVDLRVAGLTPFVTDNKDFYRVDTALVTPQVNPNTWQLKIKGAVSTPFSLSYVDLLAMPMIERDVTLACVSNDVGGPYISTARWLGVRLSDVLDRAGIDPRADQLLCTAVDGWTSSLSKAVALDGRDSMIAVGMNGEVLPNQHGFPARLVVPGLYGYVSACKWIQSITATTYADEQAYWTVRGWADYAPVLTESRIDLPRPGSTVAPGRVTIAGVAWAMHRGIDKVEVRVDDGAWQVAELADSGGVDTWRQWRLFWDAPPGDHTITVRATDGTGHIQTEARADSFPSGATGWHQIAVRVR
jgi:DMSO/TMAO reductase YedYZ molybdopterin-dependent catalytic subunit